MSCFVALLAYIEQGPLFNAFNTSFAYRCDPNVTVSGTGLNVLWCPSDTAIAGVFYTEPAGTHGKGLPQNFYFSSYAGCYGEWASIISNPSASLQQQNGAIVSNGISPVFGFGTGFTRGSVVKISSITDGTSNTIAFSEHAHGLLSSTDPENSFNKWNWWVSGNYGDTAFTVFYPINVQKKTQNWGDGVSAGAYTEGGAFLNAATSFHPGGANFAFCDGSVRFLKDSISTWALDNTGTPLGAAEPVDIGVVRDQLGEVPARRLPGPGDDQRRRGGQLGRLLIDRCIRPRRGPRLRPDRLLVVSAGSSRHRACHVTEINRPDVAVTNRTNEGPLWVPVYGLV